jgi:hypothetical protein
MLRDPLGLRDESAALLSRERMTALLTTLAEALPAQHN